MGSEVPFTVDPHAPKSVTLGKVHPLLFDDDSMLGVRPWCKNGGVLEKSNPALLCFVPPPQITVSRLKPAEYQCLVLSQL